MDNDDVALSMVLEDIFVSNKVSPHDRTTHPDDKFGCGQHTMWETLKKEIEEKLDIHLDVEE